MKKLSMTAISLLCLLLIIQLAPCPVAQADSRFAKLDEAGNELPDDASGWAVVKDRTTGLYWEVKSSDENSVRAAGATYRFSKANRKFIKALNEQKFGGFDDWRLPTTEELKTLQQKGGDGPYINLEMFPNTVAESYHSWRLCGSGEITPERIDFGPKKTKGKKRYVRAVRGATPDGADQL